MKQFLSLLAGITFLAFTSCSDDDAFKAEVEYPIGTVENQLVVDAWSSTHQLEVKADGPWRIETDDYFLTVSPESGTGNATVTLTLDNNLGERRKAGTLSFIFEGHENQNRELRVLQKYAGDYDDNAAGELETSNNVYAVGYGYDATGYWANSRSVRKEIFCTNNLIEDKLLVLGPVQVKTSLETLSGSIVNDMTNQLAAKANVEGGFAKFKAEADASFDMNHASNSNYEFASTYYTIELRKAALETDYKALLRSKRYLSVDAYYAINGVPYQDEWTGAEYTDYPSTAEGFRRLIKEYGTHVVVSASLGGRVRHSMEVDVSKVTSDYDVKAFAQASYDGLFVSSGGSVDEKYKESYNKNLNSVKIEADAAGGDEAAAKKITSPNKLTKADLDAWVESVTEKNVALVNFDQYSLVPIYELVNVSLTEEKNKVDGIKRKEALMKYMNQGEMGKDPDFSSYDCGTITETDLSYYKNYYSGGWVDKPTLVNTVTCGGQEVAYVCSEYIPLIDKSNRVTVIYPIVNNRVFFNKGVFIGDDKHKPATVEWDGTNVNIVEMESTYMGGYEDVYIRGTSIMLSDPENESVEKAWGDINQTLMTDYDGNQYGLVKIFNNIWLRQDYQGKTSRNAGSDTFEYKKDDDGNLYYANAAVNKPYFTPVGWRVPEKKDYQDIEKKLKDWNVDRLGAQFWEGGPLGYDAHVEGWWNIEYIKHDPLWIVGYDKLVITKDQVDHLTKDEGHVRIQKGGSFVVEGWPKNQALHVRLIKE